jgi:outer membrane lipoprotein SlyB
VVTSVNGPYNVGIILGRLVLRLTIGARLILEGCTEGGDDGATVGAADGATDGDFVGATVGDFVGILLGVIVGRVDGAIEGVGGTGALEAF